MFKPDTNNNEPEGKLIVGRKIRGRSAARGWLTGTLMRSLSVVLAVLVTLQMFGGVTSAMLGEPIDRDPGDSIGYTPPLNGFSWNVPNRFGNVLPNGLIDYHWSTSTNSYDPGYVHPSRFPVSFDGCRTLNDETLATPSDYIYTWQEIIGTTSTTLNSVNTCKFAYSGFATQGAHVVKLAARNRSTGATSNFTQTVTIKDWLIVSIGDSYASGEGNPDVPQQVSNGHVLQNALWEDERCHRSAKAGAAQAAMALESGDPKSSVTFISFACSGATVGQVTFDGGDPNKPQGNGILGGYRGAVPPAGTGYTDAERLPAQLDAVKTAVGDRQVDALIMSGGGNDIGFANIVGLCVANDNCWDTKVDVNFNQYDTYGIPLGTLVGQRLYTLNYYSLEYVASAIHDPSSPRHLNVANVLLTEYPNPTKNDQGNTCGTILEDIAGGWLGWIFNIKSEESNWATSTVIDPLNNALRAAVNRQSALGRPWRYITNISSAFIGPTGHGYCATDHYVNTATEAMYAQGPFPSVLGGDEERAAKQQGRGTIHPNTGGQRVVKDQLLATLRTVLR